MQKQKGRGREEGTFFHSRARIAFSRAFIPAVPSLSKSSFYTGYRGSKTNI